MPSLLDGLRTARTHSPKRHVIDAPAVRRDSVVNPMTGLGGAADKGAVGRPNPYVLPLSPLELRALYGYNGIARRIVDIVPARACRRGWWVPSVGAEDRRLLTWARFCEAMTLARLDGLSVLLMVTEDDIPPGYRARPDEWLRQPLVPERVGRLAALQVFDVLEARPTRVDRDVRSVGFRQAAEWQITAEGFRGTVHASRVIHLRGARRPPSEMRGWSGVPDDSCLQAVWDEIRRLTETLQGGAVMAQELRESVLKIGDLKSMMASDDADAVTARIALMGQGRGLLGVTIIGEGDDFQSRSNPPTGFTELSAGAWEALAAVTGIPQVILMGSTPGGLNTDGESSWEGFRQLVSSYQEGQRHELERLYSVVYAAQDGPTRGVVPEGWQLTFAPLDEPREDSVATTRQTVAETDVAYIEAGVITAADVRRARFGAGGWAFDLERVDPPVAAIVGPTADPALQVEAGAVANVAATALSGAQVQALVAIVVQVAAGTLPRDAAVAIVQRAFQVDADEASDLLGSAGRGFVPAGLAGQGPVPAPNAPDTAT